MSHSYINNYLHIVYSTKDRKNLIAPEFEPRLYSFVAETGREHGIPLIAAGGTANHSHLLILLAGYALPRRRGEYVENEFFTIHEPARN